MADFLYYNGQYLSAQEFALPYDNRGFHYNDGLFDTLLYTQNQIRFLPDHLDRMQRALQVLNLQAPALLTSADAFTQAVYTLIAKGGYTTTSMRIKVNIWRKTGGLFTPETDEAEILITLQHQNPVPAIIHKSGFYRKLPNRYTPFSFFKGPYALHYVQAGIAKKKAGLDEVILLDDKENISECLVSNIFWISNNTVFTPDIKTGCIAGIMRLNILRACQKNQIKVQEGFYKQEEILDADLIFTSNITGLRTVFSLAGTTFATEHPIYSELTKLLFE